METKKILRGGEFLICNTTADDIFIPEELNEEQIMIVQTCEDFLETEIFPNLDRIDSMEPGLMRELVRKCGDLGLLGISIPEELGGFDQTFLTSMRTNETMGAAYSFAVAYMAHTGIGTLPLLYYGNDDQKQKYIPLLATGEYAAAYCLTEPGAGSDANAGKTSATLSEDGKHYILNGQKMWITNGGFAELQTVFAKIGTDRVLSAFLVEKNFPGIVIAPEEKKMGIKGSSTVQIFYNDVKVPVENLLGKRGEGYRIALNILHIGRIKLGATLLGSAKRVITQSVNYAIERKQFGSSIANFGAIKFKMAQQVIMTWVTESAVYRATKDVENTINVYLEKGLDKSKANIEAISHYAIEAALMKVYGSEALDYVVDEAVQIFGGMGFSAEGPVDRAYRDSRINRIFEGTNEINRLLAVDTLMKRGMKGELKLFEEIETVLADIKSTKIYSPTGNYYTDYQNYNNNFKKAILMVIGLASNHFNRKLDTEQEISINISDMMMYLYGSESTALRIEKLEKQKGATYVAVYKDILDVYASDAAISIYKYGIDAIASFLDEKDMKVFAHYLHMLTAVPIINVKAARRRIADKLIEDNKYSF
jgi:alkylation response protein AidB-like acyl-CoA dehydrogenase